MARYTGPIQKKLRSLGLERFGAYNEKKKAAPTFTRKRVSEYGLQLIEKQKAKFLYGILEKQFSNYYKKASKISGSTGENLIVLLEKRLDNVLYRSGLFSTRKHSRQAANHGHFLVNSRKVNIPSYQVNNGDKISWTEKSQKSKLFDAAISTSKEIPSASWIQLDQSKVEITMINEPSSADGELVVDTRQIVEFYSR
jgi:small subunit ribosomal protein S4